MHLLDFINSHENWEELLQGAPYHLTIKWDGDYFICSYNLIESNFDAVEVCEARGSIFVWENGKAEYVANPFKKFFNYGESYAADIDWHSARVTEKIDGSLMKLWYHRGEWHLSTNGMVDAFKAPTAFDGMSFGKCFEKAIGCDIHTFGEEMPDNGLTYCFELTTPYVNHVISYGEVVWYLAAFDTYSGKEVYPKIWSERISFPHVFNLNKLDDVLAMIKEMGDTHEGVVVSDCYSNRIKIKTEEYLMRHHMLNNNAITPKKIVEYIQNRSIDDFVAYFPAYEEDVKKILDAIKSEASICSAEMNLVKKAGCATRKELALFIKSFSHRDYIFSEWEKEDPLDPYDWILSRSMDYILRIIEVNNG